MTSCTVKCVNCNIVINEVLAFLHNVLDFMDVESLHQLCTSSFSVDDIVKAKTLLFESIPSKKKMPLRRKEGKKRMSKDLDDIIAVMKSDESANFPIFVARDLHKLPPVTFDHVDVTRLLRDILILKNQLNALEEKVVTTDKFEILRQEVDQMKNASLIDKFPSGSKVNKKRGACVQNSFVFDSGPIGLQYEPQYRSLEQSADQKATDLPTDFSTFKRNAEATAVPIDCPKTDEIEHMIRECANESNREYGDYSRESETKLRAEGVIMADETANGASAQPVLIENCERVINASPTIATHSACSSKIIVSNNSARAQRLNQNMSCEQKVGDSYSEWQVVRNKSAKRYKLVGQKGCAVTEPDGKFRAADIKVPLLISNVCTDTCEGDIIAYIKEKTSEIVSLKKINMKVVKKYNAYKLYVSKSKLHLFLDDSFWPNGITFRRFVRFMYKTKSGNLVKDIK